MASSSENGNPSSAAAENQEPQQLTLKTHDGQEFLIPRSAAELSKIITTALEGDIDGDGVILVPVVDGETLAKVITYLKVHADAAMSAEEKDKFDRNFVEVDDLSTTFDVLLAANFLEIQSLLDMLTKNVADVIKNKSSKWVRRAFGVVNDYTPEEEAAQIKEDEWAHEGVDPDDDDDDGDEVAVMTRRRRIH